jgi:hypothetical protein
MASPEELRSRARQLRDEARYLRNEANNLRYLAEAEDRKEIEQARLSRENTERAEADARRRREQEQSRGG